VKKDITELLATAPPILNLKEIGLHEVTVENEETLVLIENLSFSDRGAVWSVALEVRDKNGKLLDSTEEIVF